ncbi:hypothetical protein L2E82_01028 [Cichorium intybus]|uniref:Uncharacterized protein n=1 Tax=Cichorium intybus TaxID=13427 RepID=A0ACB9GYW5_CICIN|nr:hypothetical protein L2E82_01028 [Cichorium intybus]
MAGLQYNFFPTDFLYPQGTPISRDAIHPQTLPLNTQKTDISLEDSTKMMSANGIKKQIKTLKLSVTSSHQFEQVNVYKYSYIGPKIIKTILFLHSSTKSSMAGLQYNFFPTDFLYPQPTKKIADVTVPQVFTLNSKKQKVSIDDLNKMKSSIGAKNRIKAIELLPSSSVDYLVIDE